VPFVSDAHGFGDAGRGWLERPRGVHADDHARRWRVDGTGCDDIASYLTSLFGPESVLPKSPADMPEVQGHGAAVQQRRAQHRVCGVRHARAEPDALQRRAGQGRLSVDPELWRRQQDYPARPKTGEMQDFPVPNVGTAAIHSAVPAAGRFCVADRAGRRTRSGAGIPTPRRLPNTRTRIFRERKAPEEADRSTRCDWIPAEMCGPAGSPDEIRSGNTEVHALRGTSFQPTT
jgi:hypothetical protein